MIIMNVRVRDAFGSYRGEGRLYLPEEYMYMADYDLKRELRDIFTPIVCTTMPTRNPALPWQLDIEVYDAEPTGPDSGLHDSGSGA